MTHLQVGTVTVLFAEIDLVDAITSHHGHVIKTAGDDIHGVFEKAIDAAHSTLAIQRALAATYFCENSAFELHVHIVHCNKSIFPFTRTSNRSRTFYEYLRLYTSRIAAF